MDTSQQSFYFLFFKSLSVYKQSFFILFFLSLSIFLPILFVDKIIIKLTVALYYYDVIGKFVLDPFVSSFIYAFLFVLFLYYLCVAALLINNKYYKWQYSFTNLINEANRQFVRYALVKLYIMIKIFLGFILFVLPGIVWMFLYSFSGLAVLLDDKKGKDALLSSKEIITKTWIQYLDYLLLIPLVVMGVFVLNCLFSLAIKYFNNIHIAYLTNIIALLSTAVIILAWNFILVYFLCIYNVLKNNYKEQEDG